MNGADPLPPVGFDRLDAPSGRGRLFVARGVRSPSLSPRDVYVWVSGGGDAEARRPVIYMQDGQNLFDARLVPFGVAWEVDRCVSELIDRGRLPPVIVVGISSTDARLRDYAPARILRRLPLDVRRQVETAFGGGSRSERYGRFLVGTVKPLVEARFPVCADGGSAFLAGSSMGAVVAAEILACYPEQFAGIACLSAHFSLLPLSEDDRPSDAFRAAVSEAVRGFAGDELPPAGAHRIWLDRSGLGIDRFYGPAHAALESALSGLGYRRGADLAGDVYPGVGHDEAAWRARLADALAFLFDGGDAATDDRR